MPQKHTPSTWSVVTFNTGLAPGAVPRVDERAPLIASAIAELPADLICLQEVWRDKDWASIAAQSSEPFRYRVRPASVGVEPGACSIHDLALVKACVQRSCGDLPDDQVVACAARRCASLAAELDVGCVTCLASRPSQLPDEIIARCSAEPTTKSTSGSALAYGGSYGLGLLSRWPIVDHDLVPLDASVNARGVLFARVASPWGAPLNIACTHLTPILSSIPYPGAGTWESELQRQVEAVGEMLHDRFEDDAPILFIGDINAGPGFEDVRPRAPVSYETLLEAGLRPVSPSLALGGPFCTLCDDNPLRRPAGRPPRGANAGYAIDHILSRGLPSAVGVERILDGAPQGAPAWSDHYGVKATFTLAPME